MGVEDVPQEERLIAADQRPDRSQQDQRGGQDVEEQEAPATAVVALARGWAHDADDTALSALLNPSPLTFTLACGLEIAVPAKRW